MVAEINSFDPDAIATQWLVRRDAGLNSEERARMQAWLAAAPAHARAFARAEALAADLDALPRERVLELLPATPRRRASMNWLPHALAACLMLAVACTAGFWVYSLPTFEGYFTTARGEQRSIDLPDGSRIELNTATDLQVTLYRSRREVRLAQGEAMFTVAGDVAHPFSVAAGASRVTVVGTKFNVRLDHGAALVSVLEGRVEVTGGTRVLLARAESASIDATGRISTRQEIDLQAAEAWRSGRVVLRDVALADALAEFARYGDIRVAELDNPVGLLRVTGSFDARNVEAFLRVLPQVVPVEITGLSGGERRILMKIANADPARVIAPTIQP